MSLFSKRQARVILAGTFVIILVAATGAIIYFNPRLTSYVESDRFRVELEKQTAKGLHFSSARYSPIRRTGFLSAASDEFDANQGKKALKAIDAHRITAKFNPLGVFLRRWQLDEVRIGSGEVEIQVYEPKPEPSPAKPWYHVFLPDRVYLKEVTAQPADVTWRFRNKKGGFFGTRLLITPHGRDFEYRATGGTMKMAIMPDLQLRHTHLLITKTLLTLYKLDLAPAGKSAGFIHAEGTAGTREDRSVDFKISFDRLPVEPWLPAPWKNRFTGAASGNVHWRGKDPKLESSMGNGSLRVRNVHMAGSPFLAKLAAITKKRSIEHLDLSECSLSVDWNYPQAEIKNIALEDKGKFRLEGSILLKQKSLGGALELGVAPKYLEWLPEAGEVFPRQRGGYLWTTIRLSGTVEKPEQDLSPRIVDVLKESPGAYLGVAFRLFGAWLKDAFGGD